MLHGACMNETRHIFERDMAHIWISHGTYMKASIIYIYVYTRIRTYSRIWCIHTYIYMHVYAQVRTSICMYTYVRIVYVYVYAHIRKLYVYAHIRKSGVYVHIYICTRTYMYTHMYANDCTCEHVYTSNPRQQHTNNNTCKYVLVFVCECVCVCECVHVCMSVCICAHSTCTTTHLSMCTYPTQDMDTRTAIHVSMCAPSIFTNSNICQCVCSLNTNEQEYMSMCVHLQYTTAHARLYVWVCVHT